MKEDKFGGEINKRSWFARDCQSKQLKLELCPTSYVHKIKLWILKHKDEDFAHFTWFVGDDRDCL